MTLPTALVFDTETTGLPAGDKPLVAQPYLISLAWLVLDLKDLSTIASHYSFLDTQGCIVPDKPFWRDNGLTQERVDNARPSPDVLTDFDRDLSKASLVIAHNTMFDLQIIRWAYARDGMTWSLDQQVFCTMKTATPIVGATKSNGAIKWPNLKEAHSFFYPNHSFKEHDALEDANACADIFRALVKLEDVEVEEGTGSIDHLRHPYLEG